MPAKMSNEYNLRWRHEHPESVAASVKKYQTKNRERIRIRSRELMRAYRKKYDDKHRAEINEAQKHRRRLLYYGLDRQAFQELLDQQGGKCAVCKTSSWRGQGRSPTVDHDHKTGRVRGILCTNCNSALGYIHDNPKTARAMVAYLKKWEIVNVVDGEGK